MRFIVQWVCTEAAVSAYPNAAMLVSKVDIGFN